MVSEGEGCAHPTWVDQHSLIREEGGYHGGEVLGAATDVDSEYHLLVPDK